MKHAYALALLLGIGGMNALHAQSVPSPEAFLGYAPGAQFTYHYRVVEYFRAVDAQSPKVQVFSYGRTNEDRELIAAAVSAPEHLARLDEIKRNQRIIAGLEAGTVQGPVVPVVWLSYNIHGNESVSTEAAMVTLHYLATADTGNWLQDVVVILDPCINPDGRDRYVNWYRQAAASPPSALRAAYEHHEPWPGGRYNHYLFDLNRDWCWQTQLESRQRADLYRQWMPHVHVDFHEMGPESPYFFSPPARPYHEVLTPWQREFLQLAGRNHARYFDRNGWLYFTKEVFDLYYPSYGDTWPAYQGAIGFTYEQGGSGRAGLGIQISNGDTLTLADRIAHHYTTGLSTVETAWRNRERLLREFEAFFQSARQNPEGAYKSYIIKGSQDPARLRRLLELMDRNQIRYGYPASAGRTLSGWSYAQTANASFRLEAGDLVLPMHQPQSRLLRVLFEPKSRLEDSLTYDLTAWALPYAYGVDAFAVAEAVKLSDKPASLAFEPNRVSPARPYAYLSAWKDVQDVRFLAALAQAGILARSAAAPFILNGQQFDRGTLIITRTDNPGPSFDETLIRIANEQQQPLTLAPTGFVDAGRDFGSDAVQLTRKPKVALVNGPGAAATSFGELWHYFEQELRYPATVIHTQYLAEVDLAEFDVVVLGDGNYRRFQEKLLEYARKGGRIVALEGAVELFARLPKGTEETALSLAYAEQQEAEAKAAKEKPFEPGDKLRRYEDTERASLQEFTAGSIYRVLLDASHPLAFGEDSVFFALKNSSSTYPWLGENGWNVGVIRDSLPVAGFTGHLLQRRLYNSLAIGAESYGRGELVYFADSPIFRQFWHGGKLLLGNAVFLPF
jgi:hypothetical protein